MEYEEIEQIVRESLHTHFSLTKVEEEDAAEAFHIGGDYYAVDIQPIAQEIQRRINVNLEKIVEGRVDAQLGYQD